MNDNTTKTQENGYKDGLAGNAYDNLGQQKEKTQGISGQNQENAYDNPGTNPENFYDNPQALNGQINGNVENNEYLVMKNPNESLQPNPMVEDTSF